MKRLSQKKAPTFVVIPGNSSFLISQALEARGWTACASEHDPGFTLKWKPTSSRIIHNQLSTHQIFNHFESNGEICTKNGLLLNMQRLFALNKWDIKKALPDSFLVQYGDAGLNHFLAHCRARLASPVSQPTDGTASSLIAAAAAMDTDATSRLERRPVWIVKPTRMNRGQGIFVSDRIKDVVEHVVAHRRTQWLVQKYIERPLLVSGRKFDLRLFVLFTGLQRRINVYLYREGYVRTSSREYSLETMDTTVHLTNNAVQKHSEGYGSQEEGNQLSYEAFEAYLESQGKNVFRSRILPRIAELVEATARAVYNKLNPFGRVGCFELFGYDFMIDDEMTPLLIEVNTNPCFALSSGILRRLLPLVVDDMLRLVVDPLYPPPSPPERPNGFELVWSDSQRKEKRVVK